MGWRLGIRVRFIMIFPKKTLKKPLVSERASKRLCLSILRVR